MDATYFTDNIEEAVTKGLVHAGLEDTPAHRLAVLKDAREGLQKDVDATDSTVAKRLTLMYIKAIDDTIFDLESAHHG